MIKEASDWESMICGLKQHIYLKSSIEIDVKFIVLVIVLREWVIRYFME